MNVVDSGTLEKIDQLEIRKARTEFDAAFGTTFRSVFREA
jgi:hypothetical protein